MHRPLLLRGARQLLTLRGPEGPRRGADCLNLGVINDGSVLIRDGVIVNVGQSRRVENLAEARNADVVEVHGSVVMPGFVDASAALPDNAAIQRRLLHLAFAHGTTTLGASAAYSTVRGLDGLDTPISVVPMLDVEQSFDEAQINRAVRRQLTSILRLNLHTHSREELRFLHQLGLAFRAIAPQSETPIDWLGLAIAFGASSVEMHAPLDRAQVTLLADTFVSAIVTPKSAGAARALLDGNVVTALGSGFACGVDATCSMQAAAVLAAREGGFDIAQAITLATINAAHALNAGAVAGSIETGKRADILVLHISDYRDLSNYTGVNVVSKIFQAGTLIP